MATITKGILGAIRGTVGTVTGSSWQGIDYIRTRAGARTKPSTQRQIEQQTKFLLVLQFLQPIISLIMLGFKAYAIRKTGYNAAMSYNIKNAVNGTYPSYQLDFSKVLFSRGDLPGALNAGAVSTEAGKVTFTWSDNSGTGKAKPGDKALLLVYCIDRKQAIYTTGSALRSAATETLQVTEFSGQEVETWMAFISQDGKDLASSVYTGKVTVS